MAGDLTAYLKQQTNFLKITGIIARFSSFNLTSNPPISKLACLLLDLNQI
jgi:hypothetical protein